MDLTDAEREEFTRLANATLDPDLWDESDLPILRGARAEYEREQAQERSEIPHGEQPTTDDDEADARTRAGLLTTPNRRV